MQKKRIAIIGSTGSIGKQALEVIAEHPEYLEAEVLTAYDNYKLLIKQALAYRPNVVVIGNDTHYTSVSKALEQTDIKVYAGEEALLQVLEMDTIDMALVAVVGYAGIKPAMKALQNKKPLALANKESLAVAGEIIVKTAIENRVPILPVDSEHSAIFQCLTGEGNNPVEKVVLTASGGPFLGKTTEELSTVTIAEALKHPKWNMGNKTTIDSASLMNKGLEMLEAKNLFNLNPNQIEVLIHPGAIVHSMVYFADGAIKTQMSEPDMRIAIQYAFSFPERWKSERKIPDFTALETLRFEKADKEIFRNLALAFKAMEKGGNMPAILNASNEIAVKAFLQGGVGFLQMPDIIEQCMYEIPFIENPGLEALEQTDILARKKADEIIKKLK